MIPPLKSTSSEFTAAPPPLPLTPQQSFSAPRLRSRSAPPPTLLHRTPYAAQREKILSLPLVRGLGGSDLTASSVRALTTGKTVHLTLFWGFRALVSPGLELNAAEMNTMRAYIDMAKSLGKHCKPVLLLADAHAVHNGIPQTIWEPYYAAVAKQAAELGLRTVMLSGVMAKLHITPQMLGEQGKALVRRPAQARQPGLTVLTPDDWRQLKLQCRHLCQRFPQAFSKPAGEKAKRELYESKALGYAQLRAAESRLLLPALKACFDGEAVLPVHLSDPATERLGVHGLHIYAIGADNACQIGIPWK